MAETKTFTADEIRFYFKDTHREKLAELDDDDLSVGNIEVAVAIIDAHEPGDDARDPELVRQAMQNFAEWAGDYGIEIDFEVVV